MPLVYRFDKMEDPGGLHADDNEWSVTDALIWASLYIGLPSITKANLDDWEKRLAAYQSFGPVMNRMVDGEIVPYYITRRHLERRIGMSTNVSSITDAQFRKNLLSAAAEAGRSKMRAQENKEQVDA